MVKGRSEGDVGFDRARAAGDGKEGSDRGQEEREGLTRDRNLFRNLAHDLADFGSR